MPIKRRKWNHGTGSVNPLSAFIIALITEPAKEISIPLVGLFVISFILLIKAS